MLTQARARGSCHPWGFSCDSRNDGLRGGGGRKGQKRLPIYRRRNPYKKRLNTCTDRRVGAQGSAFFHSITADFNQQTSR